MNENNEMKFSSVEVRLLHIDKLTKKNSPNVFTSISFLHRASAFSRISICSSEMSKLNSTINEISIFFKRLKGSSKYNKFVGIIFHIDILDGSHRYRHR